MKIFCSLCDNNMSYLSEIIRSGNENRTGGGRRRVSATDGDHNWRHGLPAASSFSLV